MEIVGFRNVFGVLHTIPGACSQTCQGGYFLAVCDHQSMADKRRRRFSKGESIARR